MSLFVLTSLTHEMKYFYRDGGLLGASIDVQLKEYPNISLNSLVQALGGVFGNSPAPDTQAGALDSSMTSADTAANAAAQDTVTPLVAQTGAYSLPPSYGVPAETPANVYVPPVG
jgi:anti-sigma factor ChrR (cupin superfamily)